MNYKEQALDVLNEAYSVYSKLGLYNYETGKYGHIYLDLECGYYVEGELCHLNSDDVSNLSTEDLLQVFLTYKNTQIRKDNKSNWKEYETKDPSEISDNDLEELKQMIDEDWFRNYSILKSKVYELTNKLEQINKEAGETILNPKIIEGLITQADEFYESSRCW